MSSTNQAADLPNSGSAAHHPPSNLFTSTIPVDAMHNVLRLCSLRPNLDNWSAYVPESILTKFLQAFPGVAESVFQGVCNAAKEKVSFKDRMESQHVDCTALMAYAEDEFPRLGAILRKATHLKLFKNVDFAKLWKLLSATAESLIPSLSLTIIRMVRNVNSSPLSVKYSKRVGGSFALCVFLGIYRVYRILSQNIAKSCES